MLYSKNEFHRIITYLNELPSEISGRLERQKCVCGSTKFSPVSDVSRHGTDLNIGYCQECGIIQITDYPNQEDLSWYYENVYRDLKHHSRSPKDTFIKQGEHSGKIESFLYKHLDSVDSILDYGGASGGRFYGIKEAYQKDVYIHDLDPRFVDFAVGKGLKKHTGIEKYDLVCLYHVIEHIVDPQLVLKELVDESMSDGGLLLLAVPPIDNSVVRNGPQGLFLDLHVAHKYYFSKLNLEYLAAVMGFKLIDHKSDMFLFVKDRSVRQLVDKKKSESLSDTVRRIRILSLFKLLIKPAYYAKKFLRLLGLGAVISRIGRLKASYINER